MFTITPLCFSGWTWDALALVPGTHCAPRMKFSSSAPPLSTSTSSICSPPLAACVCKRQTFWSVGAAAS